MILHYEIVNITNANEQKRQKRQKNIDIRIQNISENITDLGLRFTKHVNRNDLSESIFNENIDENDN